MFYFKINKLLKKIESKDLFSKNDLFIKIVCDTQKRVTTTKWNSKNHIWNEAFIFENDSYNNIFLEIYDRDSWSPDELLFKINFPMYLGPIKKFNMEIFEIEMGDIFFEKNSKIKKLTQEKNSFRDSNIGLKKQNIELNNKINLIKDNINKIQNII